MVSSSQAGDYIPVIHVTKRLSIESVSFFQERGLEKILGYMDANPNRYIHFPIAWGDDRKVFCFFYVCCNSEGPRLFHRLLV